METWEEYTNYSYDLMQNNNLNKELAKEEEKI